MTMIFERSAIKSRRRASSGASSASICDNQSFERRHEVSWATPAFALSVYLVPAWLCAAVSVQAIPHRSSAPEIAMFDVIPVDSQSDARDLRKATGRSVTWL